MSDAGWTDVAALGDLPDGTLLGVTLADGSEACVLNHRGEVSALGNICTHAEFRMSDGALHGDGTVECAWHGARFDCRTGAVRRHPATDPLPVHPVRIEGDRVLVGPARTASST